MTKRQRSRWRARFNAAILAVLALAATLLASRYWWLALPLAVIMLYATGAMWLLGKG